MSSRLLKLGKCGGINDCGRDPAEQTVRTVAVEVERIESRLQRQQQQQGAANKLLWFEVKQARRQTKQAEDKMVAMEVHMSNAEAEALRHCEVHCLKACHARDGLLDVEHAQAAAAEEGPSQGAVCRAAAVPEAFSVTAEWQQSCEENCKAAELRVELQMASRRLIGVELCTSQAVKALGDSPRHFCESDEREATVFSAVDGPSLGAAPRAATGPELEIDKAHSCSSCLAEISIVAGLRVELQEAKSRLIVDESGTSQPAEAFVVSQMHLQEAERQAAALWAGCYTLRYHFACHVSIVSKIDFEHGKTFISATIGMLQESGQHMTRGRVSDIPCMAFETQAEPEQNLTAWYP